MQNKFSNEEIRKKFQSIAPKYDFFESPMEYLLLRGLRKKIISKARGRVLEAGVGTGKNLKYYSSECKITAIDYSPEMVEIAKQKAADLKRQVDFQIMNAQKLKFAERKFDTIVDSLCLCTYPDPIKALKEMKRVCKKNGKILLLEHGISSNALIRKMQALRKEKHYEAFACNLMRNPEELVKKAGLEIANVERKFFGIFYLIEARPKGYLKFI